MTVRKRSVVEVIVCLVCLVAIVAASYVTASGQAKPKVPPVLTAEQKLTITALRQSIEIYRLREQMEMQKLQAVLDSLKVEGYALNDQLAYVPVKAQAPAQKSSAAP